VDPKALIFWLCLCVGGMIALVSLPLILGKIGPNPFYGLRVKRTLDDPAAWYAGNRYASWGMLATAALLMLVATTGYALMPDLGMPAYALTCLAAMVVGLLVSLVLTFRYLRRL
jgi:hypothetical protein